MSMPSRMQRPVSRPTPFYRTFTTCAAVLFCSLAVQRPLCAAVYYLDAVHGNDNYAGTTETTAWQTMAKVRSSASPGDTIHILAVRDSLFAGTWPQSMHFESPGITQYGITWFFDRPREVGQFANGDFWVAGPVVLSQISPGKMTITQDGESFVIHGNMINPEPVEIMGGYQGYDSRASHFHADLCVDTPRISFVLSL